MLVAAGILVGLAVGAALAVAGVAFRSGSRLGAARRLRQQMIADARREAEALRREAQIEAREQAVRMRAELATGVLEELEPERDRAVRVAAAAGGAARAARVLARRGFGEDAIEAAVGHVA